MEEFFGSKALAILASDFDTSRPSFTKRQKLVLELITRVFSMQKSMNQNYRKEVPFSFEFHESFGSAVKQFNIVKQGRSFESFMGKIKYKALLASEMDSGQIRHIARSYKTSERKFKTTFSKEVVASNEDLVIRIDKNTSEDIVEIIDEDNMPVYGDKKALEAGIKVAYTVKKGKKATIKYPAYPLMLMYSGKLHRRNDDCFDDMTELTNLEKSSSVGAVSVHAMHQAFVLMTGSGEMWGCGFRAQGSSEDQEILRKIETPSDCTNIRKVVHGKFFRIILTEGRKVFFNGQNRKYMYSTNVGRDDHVDHMWEPSENFYRLEDDDKIHDITAGKHYTAVVTEQGKVYAAGYIFYRHFSGCRYNKESDEDYPFELKLPEGGGWRAM